MGVEAITGDRQNRGRRLSSGRVIGLPVAAGTMPLVSQEIVRLARAGRGGHVCVANVHMVVTARRDPHLRAVMESAAVVVSDGMPLVWRLRRAGFSEAEQVRGPDLTLELCRRAAAEGLPVYFYGGEPALIATILERLRAELPDLIVAGAEAPPMLPARPAADPRTVERIRGSGARIVFVGLGCPKQEFWMQAYRPHLDAVLLGVGQAFAIAAGQVREAPAWMRRRGLEWLYRLAIEPRRLWRRYLVTNSLFIVYVVRETLAGTFRRRDPDSA